MKKLAKEDILSIVFLIIGGMLTALSFVCYYALDAGKRALVVLCIADVAYLYWNAIKIFEDSNYKCWKAIAFTVGYFFLFHLIVFLLFLFNDGHQRFFQLWDKIAFWSIFIGPCLNVVIILGLLIMCGLSYGG